MTMLTRRSVMLSALGIVGSVALVAPVVARSGAGAIANAEDEKSGTLEGLPAGRPVAGDELDAVRLAAAGELKEIRLSLAMGKPIRFPLKIKMSGLGDLGPQQVVKLRALVDAGLLKTSAASFDGSITVSLNGHGLSYDAETGIFQSVGRKLTQIHDARVTEDAAGCCCLIQSIPDWPSGLAPRWAEELFNARVFPEFEGPGSRQDTLFFERRGSGWKLTQATMPSVRLRRQLKA